MLYTQRMKNIKSNALLEWRKGLDLTQEEAAEGLSVTVRAYCGWERRERAMSPMACKFFEMMLAAIGRS